jgi:hypothetical protein
MSSGIVVFVWFGFRLLSLAKGMASRQIDKLWIPASLSLPRLHSRFWVSMSVLQGFG